VVLNFTPVPRGDYRIGVPSAGTNAHRTNEPRQYTVIVVAPVA
jgi:hypothetical protein